MQESDALTAAHLRYIAEHTQQEDPFLSDLKTRASEAGLPSIAICPEQASLMQILLRSAGARRVVEVGTLGGYSAISMARALPEGGRVDTIEVNPEHAAFAKEWVAKSDVPDRVTVHVGKGADVLKELEDGSADAAFLDADKVNYPIYLEECLRIVRSGGMILVDNAMAFGHLLDPEMSGPSIDAIRAFNETMTKHVGLQGVIVPLGDGMWVAVKR